MTVKCEMIESLYTDSEPDTKVYGFAFYKTEFRSESLKKFRDVFVDSAKADDLCQLINCCDIDEVHIEDIIQDAIG